MPSLRIHRSHRVEALAKLLARQLREHPPVDPFAPVRVIVGSREMERWLRHRLAQEIGICANADFPFPAATIDSIAEQILGPDTKPEPDTDPSSPDVEGWSPEVLVWAILQTLPGLLERPEFDALKGYLGRVPDPIDGRSFALVQQLADLLDRYITYRPDLARAWSEGLPEPPLEAADASLPWQPALWTALGEQLGDAEHRARRLGRAAEALRAGTAHQLPEPPLRFFGVTGLPPCWIDFLAALGEKVETELYLLCPSPASWDEIRAGVAGDPSWREHGRDEITPALRARRAPDLPEPSPLVTSLGRIGRDLQVVIESGPLHDAGATTPTEEPPVELPEPSALHALQADIFHDRAPGVVSRRLKHGDDSIQFHACHGPTRQVEVLRDVLLGLLEDHHALQPRDILVMTPDIEAYAPLVSAVFSQGADARRQRGGTLDPSPEAWGEAGAPRIPFRIADLSLRRLNPVADALLRLLEMGSGRCEASAVLDLLALEPVRRRFGLEPEDLPRVRDWLQEAGVRWGIGAEHRSEHDQPADPQNTWELGLQRLLLGVVMADEGHLVADRVLPFDSLEGGGTWKLGLLADFCAVLFAELRALREPRTLAEWVGQLGGAMERMTRTTEAAAWLSRRVRDELESLAAAAERAGNTQRIDLEAFRTALRGRFEVASSAARQQSGAVTFGALMPMRSVPYKVVCLLGMDEDRFPRSPTSLAFDRIARRPRAGDRDPRDEDRQLLLEAIVSAREHLVVLFTGRDVKSNEERAPAVPIGEVLDVLDATFDPATKDEPPASRRLLTEHPLQGFSPRNFPSTDSQEVRHGRSFDRRLLQGARALQQSGRSRSPFFESAPLPGPGGSPEVPELRLDELVAGLSNPSEFLLRRRLRVNLREQSEEVRDREPVELDGLQKWKLGDSMLNGRLSGRPTQQLEEVLTARGLLPLGEAGRADLEAPRAVAEAILDDSGLGIPGSGLREPDPPLEIDLDLGIARVTGSLPRLRGSLLLDMQFGTRKAKRLLRPWIELLAWHAAGAPGGRAVLLLGSWDAKKKLPKIQPVGLEAPADPRAELTKLVALVLRGSRTPLPLFENASLAFSTEAHKKGLLLADLDAGMPGEPQKLELLRACTAKGLSKWRGGTHSRGDTDDPHVSRIHDGRVPLEDPANHPVPVDLDFARTSLAVWEPLLQAERAADTALEWLAEEQP